MEIEILAAESLGVRSMAVCVRTADLVLLIDPGAALGPRRYGLPPDEEEWSRLRELKALIRRRLREAQAVVVSHYHFDHYDPAWAADFRGKRVFLKDPGADINRNQARRAREFLARLAAHGVSWEAAEGRRVLLGDTELVFSGPLSHGPGTRLGWVVAVAVRCRGEVFLHSSDVSGPVEEGALEFLRGQGAEVVFLDGPGTYLGPRFGREAAVLARRNLVRLVEEARPGRLVLDHHLLRDLAWRRWAEPVFEAGQRWGTEVLTGAEFMGREPLLLEARRRERRRRLTPPPSLV